ncbi:GIY-YIG nuclease family protein [Isoptericola sp. 178]|uniref:GIY-YIG nuclease family protein n=1 Tax=Isoptericola sp. 178 TaxID=3064651 RepID=UPI002713FAC4|nr:GIY-YIG nuclease family protein [Isoptericola sp. 178]MDO8143945.1 GIY-YIG nuclease family protein [Isoptericola sp. 178]
MVRRSPGYFGVKWEASSSRSLVDALGSRSKCGIYRLRFADGTAYVGQAIDVVQRYKQHVKDWHPLEIVGLDFRVEKREDLSQRELETVWYFEGAGNLRNKLLMTLSDGEGCALNDVVRPEDQDAWVRGGEVSSGVQGNADVGSEHAPSTKLRRLLDREDWPEIRAFLSTFVRSAVIAPEATAGRFWSVEPLPRARRDNTLGRELARVHVYGLDVLSVFEVRSRQGERLVANAIVAEPELNGWGERWKWLVTAFKLSSYAGEGKGLGYYQDVNFTSHRSMTEFFEQVQLLRAARVMTLARMRRGAIQTKGHTPELVRQILEE